MHAIDNRDGPGTELAKLIPAWVEQYAKGCDCKNWVIKMDDWGPDGCVKMEGVIVAQLLSSAEDFIPVINLVPAAAKKAVATRLVRVAIKRARGS